MSSFRRFVHLVLRDKAPLKEYSLRNIDMLRLFPTPTPEPSTTETPPTTVNLPPPALNVCPPYMTHGADAMDFMLFCRDKLLVTNQTGYSILYHPEGTTVRAMPAFTTSKGWSISVTIGESDHYAMNTIPSWPTTPAPGVHDHNFEALIFKEGGYFCRPLPPTPCQFEKFDPGHGIIRSYTVAGGGSSVWITKEGMGTYSFDTRTGLWSQLGDWALPFRGRGVYVPQHKLWFGLTSCGRKAHDTTNLLCAVDVEAQPRPVVRDSWEHVVPPDNLGWSPEGSHLIHLGSARFCITRIFRSLMVPHKFMLFTGVEVEQCGVGDNEYDGGLRMVKHRSELYVLPSDMVYSVV